MSERINFFPCFRMVHGIAQKLSIAKNTIPNLMKKYLFIFCLLLSSATYAQTNQTREEYCELRFPTVTEKCTT